MLIEKDLGTYGGGQRILGHALFGMNEFDKAIEILGDIQYP